MNRTWSRTALPALAGAYLAGCFPVSVPPGGHNDDDHHYFYRSRLR